MICATHRNLAQRVADGEFREDLFYRLREFALAIPPLRGWPALPAFIQRLWQALGAGQRQVQLSPDLLDNLARQPWPGNVRQLQSLMKVLLALADDGTRLEVDDLPAEYRAAPAPTAPRRAAAAR
ncbi:Acetoin catabolism regulatory protein [Raoultella terrigena]|uniref:Acetoin catabolism regulatory protein n=1 Tax=Raoultella terrigena TaxID=577 RepID=A0A3P8ISX1_RAOTE|nr:Acetoin catabolism regulatory protein [Raoultella terrigena]